MNFVFVKKIGLKMLVGEKSVLSNADSLTKQRLYECGKNAVEQWNLLKQHKFENTYALFRDTAISESIEMSCEYECLRKMALGYGTYGTECYKNQEMLKDILWALDWMNRHYYGRAEMENRGWRSYYEFNWHDWHIKTPEILMDIMLIVEESLTLETKSEYLALFDMIRPVPDDFASNKLMFGKLIIHSGLLQENRERVFCGINGVADTFEFSDGGKNYGQGFYTDGSYVFHTHHPQAACYGLEHLCGAIDIASCLNGSEFALDENKHKVLYYWLYNTFLPFYYKGSIMRAVCGRYPQSELASGYKTLRSIINLYAIGDISARKQLVAVLKKAVKEHPKFNGNECSEFFDTLTLYEYGLYRNMVSENTDVAEAKEHTFVFNSRDRLVSKRKNYSAALSMSSSRIYNYECINQNNLKGWYHSDGALWLYSDSLQYDKIYFEKVNPYRIAGTTVDNRERKAVSVAQRNEYLSGQDFVGGLTAGKTGFAAMQLESYHGDGKLICKDYYLKSGEYGGAPEKRESTLMAKKSYFFLEDCIVCLGTDINSSDNAPVYTVIENQKQVSVYKNGELSGYKNTDITINGENYIPSDRDTEVETNYLQIGNKGIYFFDTNKLTFCRRGEAPYFDEILLQHGTNPVGKKYAYAVLPVCDDIERFAKKPTVEIICNNEKVQAVRNIADGALYCVFWQAGEICGIKTSAPLLLCVKDGEIFACDVTQKLSKVEIQYKNNSYTVDFAGLSGKTVICNKVEIQ